MNKLKFDPQKHHRRSIRLAGFDYRQAGAYFVTLVCHQRECLLGEVIRQGETAQIQLNSLGEIAREVWLGLARFFPVRLDAWILMPNHLHGVIWIEETGEPYLNEALPLPTIPGMAPRSGRGMHGTLSRSLGAVIQNYKSVSARKINRARQTIVGPVWQRNYYERVVRDEEELGRIRAYIQANPANWAQDQENPFR